MGESVAGGFVLVIYILLVNSRARTRCLVFHLKFDRGFCWT